MKPERWQQVERLYYACLEIPAAELVPFLEQACGGDAELLREIESLLASREHDDSLLESPVLKHAADSVIEHPKVMNDSPALTSPRLAKNLHPGAVLKQRYVVETPLGHGGMGVVYRAKDKRL